MPFFNFRRTPSTAPNAGAGQPESMEVVRKRAKHRLIGSAVLVLAGVVGFPLLFDTQPRPIAVDIPIEIPGKNTVKPLALRAKPDVAAVAPVAPASVATAASLTTKEEIIAEKTAISPPIQAVAPVSPAQEAAKKEAKTELRPEPKPEPKPLAKIEPKTESKPQGKPDLKPEAKAESKPEAKPEPRAVANSAPKADDGSRAKALLDGQTDAPTAAVEARFIVQVGAFADDDKAKEVRQKLEKAGFRTYTHIAQTAGGKRTRVRVGPFASKAEADKVASKIKTLDLPAAILTL